MYLVFFLESLFSWNNNRDYVFNIEIDLLITFLAPHICILAKHVRALQRAKITNIL